MSQHPGREAADRSLVDRATRLFTFLGQTQRMKSDPPRTVDSYESVIWFTDLPEHPAIHVAGRDAAAEPGSPLLGFDRVAKLEPPLPEEDLAEWLDGVLDEPATPPELRESLPAIADLSADELDGGEPARRRLVDHPAIRPAFEEWLAEWRRWADQEREVRPARDAYRALFSIFQTAAGNAETFELVVGVGCLGWRPDGHRQVKRHLLTVPAVIVFDDRSGRLTVERSEAETDLNLELDMLEPRLTNSAQIEAVKSQVRAGESHPLDRAETGAIVQRIVHSLDSEGEYRDEDSAPRLSTHAVATFAPALILRKRSTQGLLKIFETIVQQLQDEGEVHSGIRPLVDPDHLPPVDREPSDGGLVVVDDEPFLPLPVNDVQLKILRQVDTTAQTLVQGPPGTGKTHTAAALLSHLLAQGKRVLVTAQTDRALKEVRDKLPAEVRPLAVAVVGTSREDMADLRVAVSRIATAAAERDQSAMEQEINDCLASIDRLRRERASLYHQLVAARESEVAEQAHQGYQGTLASIATRLDAEREQFGWLAECVEISLETPPPLDDGEIQQWHRLLRDDVLIRDEPHARQQLVELSELPAPAEFAEWVLAERACAATDQLNADRKTEPAYAAIRGLTVGERDQLQERLHRLAELADGLSRRREAWIPDALADVLAGRANIWQRRAQQVSGLIQHVSPMVEGLGELTEVEVATRDMGPLVSLASVVASHLAAGGEIKTDPAGVPRLGVFAPKLLKQAQPLFEQVRVDGLPPTTRPRLDAFLAWAEATKTLAALDRAWPSSVVIPEEDTLHERLQWHHTELQQLHTLLHLASELDAETRRLAERRLPAPDWTDLTAVRRYADLVDAAAAADSLAAAREPLRRAGDAVRTAAGSMDAHESVREISTAVELRDPSAYANAHHRIERLWQVRQLAAWRDELAGRLAFSAARLRAVVEENRDDPQWAERLGRFTVAWRWAATASWVRDRELADINVIQAQLHSAEAGIRRHVETLAATRAWGHAVSPERLTGQARADLESYSYQVRKLGKGTGRYAAEKRAEIRQAMDKCRPAVPVWIMPIYRIAEQLTISPDIFDVVIVDEASQAGPEAVFLQYLAPKVVVIGDDKQVSPSAVGIDQQQLRDLARQYLDDDRYRAIWQDPQASLFDLAKMRFAGMITLVEHRRCVPEIINFSNAIAYEPDGVRLIPVRQFGADRLAPIKPVQVPEGYVRGATNKINPPEVDAVVEQIEKCLTDPRYDGLTFGVISLLGKAQAMAIEKKLLERVAPEEWAARDLRCGDSADFQGSERDVMFLSMVASAGSDSAAPERRLAALTRDSYVQRYNVAASRARDQMWVFHSVSLSQLSNREDMRFRLLDHCYGVSKRGGSGTDEWDATPVPEDQRVEPFDSLFEQRVFNRLVSRGYTVIPQYPVSGYRIDLVVVGPGARLAVECDGDFWHGPDAYQRDLARQRDLERCGWTFYRIRESLFYADLGSVLEGLREVLHALNIYPSGATPEVSPAEFTPEPNPIEEPAAVEVGDDRPAVIAQRHPIAAEQLTATSHAEGGDGTLTPYEVFQGSVTPVGEATPNVVLAGVLEVVRAEGPVLGSRLHTAYVRASAGQKVGRSIARTLNMAIHAAVGRGLLIEEDPLAEVEARTCTYRLPEQSAVRPRQLGPRSLEEVPPQELGQLIAEVARTQGWQKQEQLYRAVLGQLGIRRLTSNAEDRLRVVSRLAQAPSGEPLGH